MGDAAAEWDRLRRIEEAARVLTHNMSIHRWQEATSTTAHAHAVDQALAALREALGVQP